MHYLRNIPLPSDLLLSNSFVLLPLSLPLVRRRRSSFSWLTYLPILALAACETETDITITGTDGNDSLIGTDSAETIDGLGGDDYIHGNGEDDIIDGGDGDDRIYGGADDDIIYGGAGDDGISGDSGNDTLYGGTGDDGVSGDSGNDILYGGDGDDRINGAGGNDILYGDAGNDDINGASGNDILYGGAGNDDINGGTGDDIIYAGIGNDTVYGGTGQDTLVLGVGFTLVDESGVTTVSDGINTVIYSDIEAVQTLDGLAYTLGDIGGAAKEPDTDYAPAAVRMDNTPSIGDLFELDAFPDAELDLRFDNFAGTGKLNGVAGMFVCADGTIQTTDHIVTDISGWTFAAEQFAAIGFQLDDNAGKDATEEGVFKDIDRVFEDQLAEQLRDELG